MFSAYVVTALAPYVPLEPTAIAALLEAPPSPDLGDLAFPCFHLAKELRKAPAAIATELAERLRAEGASGAGSPVAEVTAAGPYLNFKLDRAAVGARLLSDILTQGDAWLGSSAGAGRTVCIDFCSPNVARRMHLGHLRSTVIGKALARLHEAHGYRVVRINFLGDWGTQFGKLIAAWKRWGDPAAAAVDPIAELQRLYVHFHSIAKEDPAVEEEGRTWFKRLEDGDPEARQLWAWIRERSLASMKSTLSLLDVGFDDYNGEAFYEERNQAVVRLLAERGLLVENEGAQVVELESMPPCLILKADGATLYATRDLAAALHREEVYHPARSLYVVDLGQGLHFRQVFATLEKLGAPWAGGLEHVGFGIMRVGGKRLRTRAGDVIYLEDVLQQSIDLAREELLARSPGMANLDEVARAIGVGAVIFNDLKQNRQKDIDYDPAEAVSFDGETGPYVQYAHARCRNVLRKARVGECAPVPHPAYTGAPEWSLLTALARFPAAARDAMQRCEPHLAARALLDLAKALSHFYHESPVLRAEPGAREARLALVAATAIALRRGLWLLGLEAPPMRDENT
ncbi:MAG: arginine--tRNA ligase [Symbiobacteriaceae bacterium]|nr:arginine--tRNA ligase [Symbiobacteriaceae bacterium]